jgi:hypothetical protein
MEPGFLLFSAYSYLYLSEARCAEKIETFVRCFQQHFVPLRKDSISCIGAALYAALVDDLSLPTFAELSWSLIRVPVLTTRKSMEDFEVSPWSGNRTRKTRKNESWKR